MLRNWRSQGPWTTFGTQDFISYVYNIYIKEWCRSHLFPCFEECSLSMIYCELWGLFFPNISLFQMYLV